MVLKKILFIEAIFLAGTVFLPAATIYVDDDGINDPGPGDPAISDPAEDGSQEHPYDLIDEAYHNAINGDEILIREGIYYTQFLPDGLSGKAVTVRGLDGATHCIIDVTERFRDWGIVIDCAEVVRLEELTIIGTYGVGITALRNAVIKDCRIQCKSGFDPQSFEGVHVLGSNVKLINCTIDNCWIGVSSNQGNCLIDRCIITDNIYRGIEIEYSTVTIRNTLISRNGTLGVQVSGSSSHVVKIENSTIVGHSIYFPSLFWTDPAGVHVLSSPNLQIVNSILWNRGMEIKNQSGNLTVKYCSIQGGYAGEGNINTWPMFVNHEKGDYHLLSRSPCINTGDSEYVPVEGETDIDGRPRIVYGRIDIGCDEAVLRDYHPDQYVNLFDFDIFSKHWMQTDCQEPEWCSQADLNLDGQVDFQDVVIFAEHWLAEPSGSVVHLPLDGHFRDLAGGHDGNVLGDPTFVNQSNAKVGNGAIRLDGDDVIILEGYKGVNGVSGRTCMAWINTTVPSGDIFWWGDPDHSGGLWNIRLNYLGNLHFQTNGGAIFGDSVITTGKWIHIAVVLPEGLWGTRELELYVNGVRETNTTVTAAVINTLDGNDVRIGADNSGHYFSGLIDDVRIYDRALSSTEIAALYAQQAGL
ncbi:MAG: right-handed parallel beta-helix repeat-containing protein [Sedimentisphaerales bacterium]|nr:right-handed parallel beta-helix repeat-containing protein [Sedimentisphaerales bacterium]